MLTILTPLHWIARANHLSACVGLSAADLHYMGGHTQRRYHGADEYLWNAVTVYSSALDQLLDTRAAGIPVTLPRPAWDTGTVDEDGNTVYAVDLDAAQEALQSLVEWRSEDDAILPHDGMIVIRGHDPRAPLQWAGMTEQPPEPV